VLVNHRSQPRWRRVARNAATSADDIEHSGSEQLSELTTIRNRVIPLARAPVTTDTTQIFQALPHCGHTCVWS
jgi:hypothetical protein